MAKPPGARASPLLQKEGQPILEKKKRRKVEKEEKGEGGSQTSRSLPTMNKILFIILARQHGIILRSPIAPAMYATLPFILASVLLSTIAQLLLKHGAASGKLLRLSGLSFFRHIAFQPAVWLGLLSFGASLALWMIVLSRLPVSRAYPFVSLGIVMTTVAGAAFYHEPVTLLHSISIVLIVAGVSILALA